jgi:uncharacterized protein YbjQ (UPF0145 family)
MNPGTQYGQPGPYPLPGSPYGAPPPSAPASVPGYAVTASAVPAEEMPPSNLLVTTTDRIDGRRIVQYIGVVAGEVVLGTSLGKDIKASFRGFMGGRSRTYEREIRHARREATREMVRIAEQLGADAVVGVRYSYVTVNALVMVAACGTAVRTEELASAGASSAASSYSGLQPQVSQQGAGRDAPSGETELGGGIG